MNMSERIKTKRKELGLTQSQLAKAVGIKQPSLSSIERGESKDLKATTLKGLAKALQVTPEWLETGKEQPKFDNNITPIPNLGKVPLISFVQAGDWAECVDPYPVGTGEDMIECPVPHSENTFALRVSGESMEPRFHSGEIIFVDPCRQAENKDFVVAKLDHQNAATFKQLVIEDGNMMLKALNPDWPTHYMPIDEDAHIIGKVIARLEQF